MRKYIPIYYLLCVLLVLGAFAAMAQNSYGLALLGMVAGLFGLVFFVQLVTYLGKARKNQDTLLVAEHIALVFISAILSLRVFYIRFPLVEEVFVISGLLLAVVFSVRLVRTFRNWISRSNRLAWSVVFFHLSIILYLLSMSLMPVLPVFSQPLGTLAFLLLLGFALQGIIHKKIMLHGEKASVFSWVNRFRDHSIILVVLFVVFTGYVGLTGIGVIPRMYNNEYPQAYFKLLEQAERGEEKPDEGVYRHEVFKAAYDHMIRRNSN